MSMIRRSLLASAATLAFGSALLPLAADAQAVRPNKGLLLKGKGTWRNSTTGATGEDFEGDVLIQRFSLDKETRTLRAHGIINKTGGSSPPVVNQPFTALADLTDGSANKAAA